MADSVADFVTLEISITRDPLARPQQQDPFEITRVVKMSPLTEKPFSAYEIRVVETNELVKKRYREFDKLYFQIKAQLPNSNVPKLPKKKFFGNMDESFVEKRRLQLQTWLNTVARLPGVEESGWVSNFLWTDLKIRGVKAMSEVERFQRTLQRQADEARLNAVQSASASLSSQHTSSTLAWPNKMPETKPSAAASSSSSTSTAATQSAAPTTSFASSLVPTSNAVPASSYVPSSTSSSSSSQTPETIKTPGKSKASKEKRYKRNRRLSQ